MPISQASDDDGQLFTHVDDEQYDDLSELTDQPVVHISVWEEGLVNAMTAPTQDVTSRTGSGTEDDAGDDSEVAADIDLYLRDGVYFELYGTLCYTALDAPPLADLAQIEQELHKLVEAGVQLEEIAVDEEEGLVLVLAQHHQPVIYLQVGAWLLDEWEELPESSAS